MKVYIFGNEDDELDSLALTVVEKLRDDYPTIQFVFVKPNEDLPFSNEEDVVLMDVVDGIDEVTLLEGSVLDSLILPPRASVHDFDLGFQLKYLGKLGKLGKVKVVGLPVTGSEGLNYRRIHSIFKKLVAQDIQGS